MCVISCSFIPRLKWSVSDGRLLFAILSFGLLTRQPQLRVHSVQVPREGLTLQGLPKLDSFGHIAKVCLVSPRTNLDEVFLVRESWVKCL